MQSGGGLQIQLAGTGADELDVLDVGGSAQLGGTLAVHLEGSFMPRVGDTFRFLNATSMSGVERAVGVALADTVFGLGFGGVVLARVALEPRLPVHHPGAPDACSRTKPGMPGPARAG